MPAPLEDPAQRAHGAGQAQAEQVVMARCVHHLHHVDVVVQMLSHTGQVVQHGQAERLQMGARPHTREHQQLW